ncbi:hypothetical protein F5Y02DRAFT_421939 [Annulohypoxylon stygium]|nr:hypothetical protein F5Y02DRAFT_421939 [Annulohypoxylon stygium]
MSAELGLSIVATIDLCLKYGKEVRNMCSALKNAEIEIEERTLRLENGCFRCMAQLQFLQKADYMMDDDHRALLKRTLRMLVEKLSDVHSILENLIELRVGYGSAGAKEYTAKRLKYAFKKDKLDGAINVLETWQQISDPSWFLVMRMSDRRIDEALVGQPQIQESIPSVLAIRRGSQHASLANNDSMQLALPATDLDQTRIEEIMFSEVKLINNTGPDGMKTYVLDRVGSSIIGLEARTKKNTRNLARRLQHDEPQNFGLLSCKGFVEKGDPSVLGAPTDFTLVFRVPPGLTGPQSLRYYLLGKKLSSLSHRFSIAQQLARSVTYVHIFGFVHKNVRPENVLGFSEQGNQTPLTFLVGFKDFRMEEGHTEKHGDSDLEKNLYHHPTRQGASPRSEFIMQHDIYSLGVCLLEIGLWQSFIQYDRQNENPALSEEFKVLCDAPEEHMAMFLLMSVKDRLVELARSKLREHMGDEYSRIVETCLTCLDPDNADFGDPREFEDEDGIRVGVRYIEKVLQRLDSLKV